MGQSLWASSNEWPLLLHYLGQVAPAGKGKWSGTSLHTRSPSPARDSKCIDHQRYGVYPVVGLYLPYVYQPKSSLRRHLFRLSICTGIAKHATAVFRLFPSSEELERLPEKPRALIFLPLPSTAAEVVLKSCWAPCGWEPASSGSYGEGTCGKRSARYLLQR